MGELHGGDGAVLAGEARDARQRFDLPVVPQAKVAGADPPFRRYRRGLDDHQSGAAGRARAVVDEMPVGRDAVVRRVLAHRRQADAVGQYDVAKLEGVEEMGHVMFLRG